MKNWSQFYTPPELARLLIESIAEKYIPSNVVDICAGSCNLLYAAAQNWPKANFFGSDIEIISNNFIDDNSISIKQIDAININKLISTYKRKKKKLVLANPPFGYYKSLIEFELPTHLKKLYYFSKRANRIECQILVSNLSILNEGDYFAAIMPENIFTAEKMYGFRNALFDLFKDLNIKTHSIKFEKTEVKTRILTGIFNPNIKDKNNMFIGNCVEKGKNAFQIIRGIDNSILTDNLPNKTFIEVLHFNNTNGEINQIKTVENNIKYKSKFIQKDDVLIFRVGRNAGKLFIPDNRHFGRPPSDLLLILKDAKKLGKRRLKAVEKCLEKKKKGLTSKYISKSDVLNSISEITVPNRVGGNER